MAKHKNIKFTLDGKSKFTVGDETFRWQDRWMERVDHWALDSNKTYTSTVTLKGSNWYLESLSFSWGRTDVEAVIKDANDASGRTIKFLETDDAGSLIVLKSTRIDDIVGADGEDKVTLGSQGADTLRLRGGNDTVTGTSGGCELISLGDGDNVFNSGNMWVGTVMAFEGNDTFTVSGDGEADAIIAGQGNNTINVTGNAWVGNISAHDGNDTVNISTSNSVDMIRLSNGDNTLIGTGSGWIGTVLAFEGDDTIDLTGSTAQYAGYFALGHGDNIVRNGSVFVESILTNSGDDTFTIGTGGAGQITSWGDGNDTLTSAGWIGSILFNNGADSVTLLAGGTALSVLLRNGNDSLSVSEVTNADVIDQTCMFNGGDGTDTISFAQFTHAVAIDLDSSDAVDTGYGIFVVANFENLTGGSAADTLAGVDGGTLTGGGGADVFVYADGDGDVAVADFSIAGGDRIDLSGLEGFDDFTDLDADSLTQNGDNTEITGANGDVLVLTGVDKDDLTSGQFLF